MPAWDSLTPQLEDQARSWAEERRARKQRAAYESWAKAVVDEWAQDLQGALSDRLKTFTPELQGYLTNEPLETPRGWGTGHALRLALGGNEVLVQCRWEPDQAPNVHLTWSRQRRGRYCQLVPVAVGWLVPRHLLTGYRLVPADGSSDELPLDGVIFRAFELLRLRPTPQ